MKKFRHIIFTSIFAALLLGGAALPAFAATINLTSKLAPVGTAAGFGTTSLAATAGQIIRAFLSLLGLIFLSYTIYAGYIWLTAAGNDEKLTKAKAILRGSIIGLIITLSAYAITTFVMSRLGEATGSTIGLIKEASRLFSV
jgi:hypothetical protein